MPLFSDNTTMKSRGLINISFLITSLLIIFFLFWFPANQEQIVAFAIAHVILAPIIVIIWRILAVVIPPIPGGILSFLLIPIYGWLWSYIFAFLGIIIGASIAFWIARVYRKPLVSRFVPLQQLHAWEEKVSRKKEFLAFLGIRLTTAPIMDFISYIAGLSKINFRIFFFATALSELPNIALYYFSDVTYKYIVKHSSSVGFLYLLLLPALFLLLQQYKLFKKEK